LQSFISYHLFLILQFPSYIHSSLYPTISLLYSIPCLLSFNRYSKFNLRSKFPIRYLLYLYPISSRRYPLFHIPYQVICILYFISYIAYPLSNLYSLFCNNFYPIYSIPYFLFFYPSSVILYNLYPIPNSLFSILIFYPHLLSPSSDHFPLSHILDFLYSTLYPASLIFSHWPTNLFILFHIYSLITPSTYFLIHSLSHTVYSFSSVPYIFFFSSIFYSLSCILYLILYYIILYSQSYILYPINISISDKYQFS